MNIAVIPTGAYQENCSIVWTPEKEALVFDPGDDAPLILQTLEAHQLKVVGYICTHTHADHINALAELHQERPAPVAVHSKDLDWAFEPFNTIAPYYSVPTQPDVEEYLHLETAVDWNFGTLHFQCIETPGHTPGGCCLLFPEHDILIAGDTLFKGSCGRSDLPGGDARQLRASLDKLKQLPDEVRVYTGHGEDTTIGMERETNFYMQ